MIDNNYEEKEVLSELMDSEKICYLLEKVTYGKAENGVPNQGINEHFVVLDMPEDIGTDLSQKDKNKAKQTNQAREWKEYEKSKPKIKMDGGASYRL
nr:hypothetical protein [Tanacetum cinerariifolium]